MAKTCDITREQQDALAHRSHQRAAQAWLEGKPKEEVVAAFTPPYKQLLIGDSNTRDNSSSVDYARLRSAFNCKHGTITATNSMPLADGATAVVLTTRSWAKEPGLVPLGYLHSYVFTTIDVWQGMLFGPAWSTPLALERIGLTMGDLILTGMHEALAAQTLANIQLLGNERFTRDMPGRAHATGEVDESKFNVLGGLIVYGHSLAATGTQTITQTLHEFHCRGGGFSLVTACVAGGLGTAMALEAE